MVKTAERLTPKQAIWVGARSAGATLAEATEAAGYTSSDPNTLGAHIQAKPHIQTALARAGSIRANSFAWTVDAWRQELGLCMRDAQEATDLPSRLRALELAGKHLGALEPSAPISQSAMELIAAIGSAMAQHKREQAEIIDLPLDAHAREGARARTRVLTEGNDETERV